MDFSDFGLWAMLAFWGSAISGIYLAVSWANKKSKKSPAPRDVMIKSLDKRLSEGELTPEEYERRLKNL
ncbi:MAG: SHOCT domain-containing protein [Cycloclasticus sp.]|nr:SHOCT domain-containing protein [Cycloclasticus sp.]